MPIPEAIPEAENYTDEPVKSPGFETVLYKGERYSFTSKRQKAAMPKARLPEQASDRRERDNQVVASLG
jgi:hypothetical protein